MRSLFEKLLIINIGIILVGFIILSFTMSHTLENYFIEQKEELLMEQAENIAQQYVAAFGKGIVDLDRFSFELEALDRYLDARIWMINRRGQIYVNSGAQDLMAINENLNIEEIQEVFEGNLVKRRGNFQGYFQEPVLTIGYPIRSGNEVVLALFIHASIPEIQRTAGDIGRITLISLLVSSVLAIILIFLTSKSFTKEIGKLNEGVRRIARGDFDKRLEVTRRDELGELATNFNKMAEDLSQLEKLRRNFISNLSHDLRSPLTSINGFIKGILDGTIEREKHEKYLNLVLEESQRLTKLTNDILDLSKMESGELDIEMGYFDMNQLILNVVDKLDKGMEEKEIQLQLSLTPERIKTYGDIQHIQRVVYNLLDNAVKFTPQGESIHIQTEIRENKMVVRIGNSGVVISKKDLEHIWDRFNKLDPSRGQDKKGSGLGLAIVKEIMKAHHQEIHVYSDTEIGVEFVFSLLTNRS